MHMLTSSAECIEQTILRIIFGKIGSASKVIRAFGEHLICRTSHWNTLAALKAGDC